MLETLAPIATATVPSDGLTFKLIFALGFVLLFVLALLASMVGLHWRDWLPGAEGAKSLPGGVRTAVYTFMSHLQ